MSNRFFPPQQHQYISTSQTKGLRLSRLLAAAAGLTSYKVNKMAVVTEVCSGVMVVFVNFGVHRALRTSYRLVTPDSDFRTNAIDCDN
ncbi:hypothetical protein Pcinc_008207 [Petrolisthes cinctipes]|uniref:Uncharacterized protein n=1 Tax=Petrolisthes cinctipes TaxID=88211 RepID=A0AAE1G9F8_PETCI|nr:hypothetical protein Pcinc_008207 [Petrolisthes cinctipes]